MSNPGRAAEVPVLLGEVLPEAAKFVGVAELIAGGAPPEWLVDGLFTLSQFVGVGREDREDHRRLLQRMVDEIDHLTKWLPGLFHPGIPKDIAIALVVLPRIKQLIVPALKGRARSFGTNKLCAQAVVEAWRCMHGEVEVRSEQAYLACQAYWKACGGKEIGKTNDILNWRRRVEAAAAVDHSLAKAVFAALYKTT